MATNKIYNPKAPIDITSSLTWATNVIDETETDYYTQFYKIGNMLLLIGCVALSSGYFSGTYKDILFLPEIYRPTYRIMVPANTGASIWTALVPAKAQISTDGSVSIYAANSGATNLTHAQFEALYFMP